MTDLTVIDTASGEIVALVTADRLLQAAGLPADLTAAEFADLAEFTDRARELQGIAGEATGLVHDELRRRMDASAQWTIRDAGWEAKAPSPDAGTTGYDADRLRAELESLAWGGVIDMAAVDAACPVTVPSVAVTWEELTDILTALLGEADQADHARAVKFVRVHLDAVCDQSVTVAVRLPGVNRLRKLGGRVAEAIDACRIEVEAPPRRVKVTRTDGGRS